MGENDYDDEQQDGMELEDLDEKQSGEMEDESAGGEQNPMPPQQGNAFTRTFDKVKDKSSNLVEGAKVKANEVFESVTTGAENIYENNKDKVYPIYDRLMDFKDEIKDATKNVDGKWNKVKTGAGVVRKHIQNSDTYKAIANSGFGKAASKGFNSIKTGANKAMDWAAGTKLGKWIAKKKAEKEAKADEPGIFSRMWTGIKTGANKAKDWAAGTKLGKWVSKKIAEKKAKADEPGIFSRMWTGIKSGANKAKDWAAGTKLGKWVSKKIAEKKAKADEPGIFSKMWGGIKSGATKAKNWVAGTKAGKWVANKAAQQKAFLSNKWKNIKTGAAGLVDKVKNSDAGKWVSSEYNKGKAWVGEQKEWLNEKKDKLLQLKNKVSDELDDHEHERRMAYKAKNGDPDYGKRYNEYVTELKSNPEIQNLLSKLNPDDVKRVIDELESGKEEKKKDGLMSKAASGLTGAAKAAKSSDAQDYMTQKFGSTAAGFAPGALGGASSFMKAIGNAQDAKRLSGNIDEMNATMSEAEAEKDQKITGFTANRIRHKKQQKTEAMFDFGSNALTGLSKTFGGVPGAQPIAKITSFAAKGINFMKDIKVSGMDKENTKLTVKEIFGGVEGYKAMKSKYKLQAQEMKRGLREATGMRADKDVAQLEEENLLDYAQKRAGEGSKTAQKSLEQTGEDDIRTIRENGLLARNNTRRYGGLRTAHIM